MNANLVLAALLAGLATFATILATDGDPMAALYVTQAGMLVSAVAHAWTGTMPQTVAAALATE